MRVAEPVFGNRAMAFGPKVTNIRVKKALAGSDLGQDVCAYQRTIGVLTCKGFYFALNSRGSLHLLG